MKVRKPETQHTSTPSPLDLQRRLFWHDSANAPIFGAVVAHMTRAGAAFTRGGVPMTRVGGEHAS